MAQRIDLAMNAPTVASPDVAPLETGTYYALQFESNDKNQTFYIVWHDNLNPANIIVPANSLLINTVTNALSVKT